MEEKVQQQTPEYHTCTGLFQHPLPAPTLHSKPLTTSLHHRIVEASSVTIAHPSECWSHQGYIYTCSHDTGMWAELGKQRNLCAVWMTQGLHRTALRHSWT